MQSDVGSLCECQFHAHPAGVAFSGDGFGSLSAKVIGCMVKHTKSQPASPNDNCMSIRMSFHDNTHVVKATKGDAV